MCVYFLFLSPRAASESVLVHQMFQCKLTQTGSLVPQHQRLRLRGPKGTMLNKSAMLTPARDAKKYVELNKVPNCKTTYTYKKNDIVGCLFGHIGHGVKRPFNFTTLCTVVVNDWGICKHVVPFRYDVDVREIAHRMTRPQTSTHARTNNIFSLSSLCWEVT